MDKMAQSTNGTKVTLMQVAGGSFTQVQVRRGRKLLYNHNYISHDHVLAERDYREQCRKYDAS